MRADEILPQSAAAADCAARIAVAGDVGTLAGCAGEARAIALALQGAGAGSALVTGVLSRLNDAVTAQVLLLAQRRFRLPPARWCWLGLGSEGRLEQTLATDQDNGLLFSASDDGEARDLRERFLPFAKAVNQDLAACGFPLCDGEVMAGNPRWCLSQAEWLAGFTTWVRTPEPEALLNAAIFFDFRPLAGDAELAIDLRRVLGDLTRGNEIFLRMMATNALAAQPPLGRLRDFVTEGEGGTVDLKKYGSRIFVDAARIFALTTGVSAVSTVERLHAAAGDGIITPADAAAATQAFLALQATRLSAQATGTPGVAPGNLIVPESLNEFERRVLLEALRQARALQQRLKTRFQIET